MSERETETETEGTDTQRELKKTRKVQGRAVWIGGGHGRGRCKGVKTDGFVTSAMYLSL